MRARLLDFIKFRGSNDSLFESFQDFNVFFAKKLRMLKMPANAALIVIPPLASLHRMGSYDLHFNDSAIQRTFGFKLLISEWVQPIVDAGRQSKARIILIGAHSMGSNMPAKFENLQGTKQIQHLNEELAKYCAKENLTFLNPYNLTKGQYSMDGVHYAWRGNLRKLLPISNVLKFTKEQQ